ncbi:MAG: FAD-binding oxidoreductase [Chloroflexi bacterium]|nr:FAD-binding oxidoreductase [Chloroflexota bacterium]
MSSDQPARRALHPALVRELRTRLRGAVLEPDGAGYADASAAWNVSQAQHPSVVALVADAADARTAVEWASRADLPIGVQATGHGIAAACDGLLINTGRLSAVQIDPAARTARAESGVRWDAVVQQAASVGLAPLCGSSPVVGVVGYTLGGGAGWLARAYGLAADSVRSADVVTADGQAVQANASSHPDLFWGLRGGGGNFGLVTALDFDLYPVTDVYGGAIFYPIELTETVLSRWAEWTPALPDRIGSDLAIMNFPPLPQLPEPLRGQSLVTVRGCAVGMTNAEAIEALRPMRTLGTPVVDTFGRMPFTSMGTISGDPVDPTPVFGRAALLKTLTPAAIAALVEVAGPRSHSPLAAVEIRYWGGAIARVPAGANAVSHRDQPYNLHIMGILAPPDAADAVRERALLVDETMRPYTTGAVAPNFLGDHDVGPERTRAAYSAEHYGRLVTLKDAYDPRNVFRFNHNIPPSAG